MPRYDVTIYCDGSADLKDGSGGWACILIGRRGKRREFYQGKHEGHTNQTAEIMAAILGMSKLKRDNLTVKVISDSEYVVKAFREGWIDNWIRKKWRHKGGERPNREFWETLHSLVVLHERVDFVWVKGHNGDENNERCDALADQGRRQAVTSHRYFEQQLEIRRLGASDAVREAGRHRGKATRRRGRRPQRV